MSDDRNLAEAIYDALTTPASVTEALGAWDDSAEWMPWSRMSLVLDHTARHAIASVLARRQREAARTGPWDCGHHFQEEDGYPGSLPPPKRGTP